MTDTTTGERVLIVEDEPSTRLGLTELVRTWGFAADSAADGEEALQRITVFRPSIIISDLVMPRMGGLDLLRALKDDGGEYTVVILTAQGTVETAVEAIKEGAYDYLTKPIEPQRLKILLDKVVERQDTRREVKVLRRQLREHGTFGNMIGSSPSMRKVYQVVEQAAPTSASVLIWGESGTGKELVAKTIHQLSPRAQQPFVPINCAAIPETLLESEIFGHEKGAFTGASDRREGCFELADRGTLFLDEIAEMTPATQVKLLRVLQERKFRRLGGVEELEGAMRVIAATNQDLTKLVADGKFREDLFYRINVIPIHLPPLRDREEDIPLLAEYFLAKYRDQMGKDIHGLSQETMDLLDAYEWPGNIRELENVIERAVALEKSQTILPDSLPEHIAKRVAKGPAAAGLLPESGFNLEEHVEGLEKEYITQALVRAGGVQVKAAELLGMSFRSFRYYVKKYNLK
jgi:DNA-binding NtrC family response regulator